MAVTPVGNPYVESSDLVANYPGASEALAERIDIVGVNPFANAAARDAAIPSPVQGQMCSLNDDNKGYRYDGSAWVLFSGAVSANFTNTATGTYTSGGIDYKYITFTGSGSLVVDRAGQANILVLGGGSGGKSALWNGQGGYSVIGLHNITAATHTITIGAGGPGNAADAGTATGVNSSLGTLFSGFGAGVGQSLTNFTSSVTGSSVTYATSRSNAVTNNSGNGGNSSGNYPGSSGVVIVAVAV